MAEIEEIDPGRDLDKGGVEGRGDGVILQDQKGRAGLAQGLDGLQVALTAAKMARLVGDALDEAEIEAKLRQRVP
jgi:hypothetical protein